MELLNPIFAVSFPSGAEIILILVALGYLFIWIKTIVEIAKSRFTDETSRIIWLLVVAFCGLIGMILYYAIGRKNRIIT